MPFPKTRDMGKVIRFIKREHPEWPHDKAVAAALNQARKSGAKIPKKKKVGKRKKGKK